MWHMGGCCEGKTENRHNHKRMWSGFILGAFVSMIASLVLQLKGRKHESLFIGQWVPTLLLLGLYKRWILRHFCMQKHH